MEPIAQETLALLQASPLFDRTQNVQAAATFYETLFKLHPELRGFFPDQMADQSRKFAATLAISVHSLSDWEAFKPVLEALARRHLNYGVTVEHYGAVGTALIQTLNDLGCDPAQIDAWCYVYGVLSEHMIATAYPLAA